MRPTQTLRTPEMVHAMCQHSLEQLRVKAASVRFACLGTVDGRAYAFAGVEEDAAKTAQRMSAIACSLLALSESFSRESLHSNCSHALIAAERGNIIVVRVPCHSRAYVLAIGVDASDIQAISLRRALDLAHDLAGLIDSEQ